MKNVLVKPEDMAAATGIVANAMANKKINKETGMVEVEVNGGETISVPPMNEMDIQHALRSESIRAAIIIKMAQNGVTLDKMAKTAAEGLDAFKLTNKKDDNGEYVQIPDFVTRNTWWKSIVEVMGVLQQQTNVATTVDGEKVLDPQSMTRDELDAALEAEIKGIMK